MPSRIATSHDALEMSIFTPSRLSAMRPHFGRLKSNSGFPKAAVRFLPRECLYQVAILPVSLLLANCVCK